GERPAGQGEGARVISAVGVERSAASLALGHDDVAAVLREHARGCTVVVAEDDRLDAASEQRHAGPPRPRGGDERRQRCSLRPRGQRREQRLPRAEGPRERPHDAAPADEGLETTGLIEAKPGGGQPEEPWMAQEQTEVEPAEEAADGRARPSALHLGLRGLDEPTVGHARRADGLTRAAVEAEREMARHAVRERDPPLRERLDEKDAPTR